MKIENLSFVLKMPFDLVIFYLDRREEVRALHFVLSKLQFNKLLRHHIDSLSIFNHGPKCHYLSALPSSTWISGHSTGFSHNNNKPLVFCLKTITEMHLNWIWDE